MINAIGGGFAIVGMAGDYGTEEWDFHLMLLPELSWIDEPVDQLWSMNVVPIPTYQLKVTSAAPMHSWQVNNTHFTIGSTGILQNTTLLNGTYPLRITVIDSVGNILIDEMTIVATMETLPVTTPSTTFSSQDFQPIRPYFIAAIGVLGTIVVIVILIRRKGR